MPKVSIILPTYNRARFLPQAFEAILAQTWADWELIIIDDGSTDNTLELVERFRSSVKQNVVYRYQQNQGAYGARNTGLDLVAGEYVAFYDSDDVWLAHHLSDCVVALDAHTEVDWVYGATRIIEEGSGRELAANAFYRGAKARPFLCLKGSRDQRLFMIDDPEAARCQILHGLFCGLQNSVIRRCVFANYRFAAHLRNEAEDQVVVIRSLKAGHRFAYFDNIHVIYRVHGDNSSAASGSTPLEKRLRIQQGVIAGFELMRQTVPLTSREARALKHRLSAECFWVIGYSLLWQNDRRLEALPYFRQGLELWPTNWRYWKTYLLSRLKTMVGRPRLLQQSA